LSARYSTSPSLNLRIGRSRLRGLLYLLLALCLGASLVLLGRQGYPLLALSLLAPAGCCFIAQLRRDGVTALEWGAGQWTLRRGSERIPIRILPGSSCLPWVIYLGWASLVDQRRGSLWLFADSAPAADLRRLRVRLSRQR
jgi:hypothetical protein